MITRTVEILLADDNPGNSEPVQDSFGNSKVVSRIYAVDDIRKAADFLLKRGAYAHAVTPDVILLNLAAPMDGKEVLETIGGHTGLRRIPVAALTRSDAGKDVVRSYRLHARCHVTRPVDLSRFLEIAEAVEDFWLNALDLPQQETTAIKKERRNG